MTEPVVVTQDGSVIDVVLNRPEKKNALTSPMYAGLVSAITQGDADPRVRAVVVHATGSAFCAGNDLQDFASGPPGPDSPVAQFLRVLARTEVPLVAAVHGPAVGVGATMLLHFDHVVAAQDAVLQYPFVNRALVPEAGSSLLLPRVVGYLRASEIMLTGQNVSADEALALGLVSRVVPTGEHVAEARAFVQRLAGQPPAAVRLTKRLLRDDSPGLEQRMAAELELFVERLQSPEFMEAVSAFLQKRAPDFDSVAS